MGDTAKNILAEPEALAELAQYQDGSVVSREVVKKGTGTVTVFAFDAGQGLSEHTAPFDAMVLILDGEASITVSGKVFTVKANEALILPSNEPHALDAKKRFKMALIMIKS